MGLFDFFKVPDINEGLHQFEQTPGAVLLDVRTPQEFSQGHLPHSKNIPLGDYTKLAHIVPDKNTPLFIYCYSGSRSRQAVKALQRMGYGAVTDLGGIHGYRGKLQ